MFTALFTHAACLEHDTGLGHPECPDRLSAVLKALEADAFKALDRREAPQATMEQLLRVHPQSHIDFVRSKIPQEGRGGVDADTVVSPGSWEAALRSAGAVCAAVDAVATGGARNAF